jgi:hypothetical protein
MSKTCRNCGRKVRPKATWKLSICSRCHDKQSKAMSDGLAKSEKWQAMLDYQEPTADEVEAMVAEQMVNLPAWWPK